jgi:IQ and AAA domain-containing protein
MIAGTESEFSRSSAPSSKESKKTAKDKGGKEKGKGDEPVMDEGFKKGFKPDESSFLPEIKTGIDEYHLSHRLAGLAATSPLLSSQIQ